MRIEVTRSCLAAGAARLPQEGTRPRVHSLGNPSEPPVNTDYLILAAGTLLAVAGLALAAWALRGERARGRRRCPRCWYNMSGSPGLRCPECGRTVKRESALQRARRRWLHAGAGVLMIALSLVTSRPLLFAWDTWAAVLPLSAWRIWVPLMDPDAVTLIETDGAKLVQSRTALADQIRTAYRIRLILDGRADPGKAAVPPPPTDDLLPDNAHGNPWTPSWFTTPSDVQFVLQIARTIDPGVVAAIAMPSVHRVLRDPTAPVDHRVECLHLIRAVEGEEQLDRLIAQLAASDPAPLMRGSALWLIEGRLTANNQLLSTVIAAVSDEDPKIRIYALRLLEHGGSRSWNHRELLPTLLAALRSDDTEVRRNALDALVVWGPAYACNAVEEVRALAAADPDRYIRAAAADLLERIKESSGPP